MYALLTTAVCYIPYALLLSISLLLLPALAIFPALTSQPRLALSIPIISLTFINGIALILLVFGIYSQSTVLISTIVIGAIAIYRQWRYYHDAAWQWPAYDQSRLLLNISLVLPMLAIAGLSAFMIDDALVSWNVWAIDFYQQKWPRSNGYPPFFPLFLSYADQLLGHIDYQGPVKFLLCFFPFTILNTLIFSDRYCKKSLLFYLCVILICVFPGFLDISFYRFYTRGYADPLFAAALAVSVFNLLHYLAHDQEKIYLWLAVIAGITASLSKQPGFLWALWGFPLLILKNRRVAQQEILAWGILLLPLVLWLINSGAHFYQNTGVISRSLTQPSISLSILVMTLWHSIIKYLLYQPTILLLYILAGLASWKKPYKNILFWGFIIPETVLWFIFGAYEIRLGLHVLVLCGLLIFSTPMRLIDPTRAWGKLSVWLTRCAFILGILLFIIFSLREQLLKHHSIQGHIYPLNSPKQTIYYYFSSGAPFIYQHLYHNPAIKLWSTTPYISSIFYGYNQLVTPPDTANSELIYQNLLHTQPAYIFTSHKIISQSSIGLGHVIQQHPELFQEIFLGQPFYQYHLYKFTAPSH